MTLFDSGATANVMSKSLCKKLHLETHKTKWHSTIEDNKEALVVGEESQMPVTLGTVRKEFSGLVVSSSSYSLIVGRPLMKKMRVFLDFDKNTNSFFHSQGPTRIPLITEGSQGRPSLSDEFKSEGESNEEAEEREEDNDEESESEDFDSLKELLLLLGEEEEEPLF